MSQRSLDKYHSEILSKLEKFKSAREWSDFIEPLDSLSSVFKKYNAGFIPATSLVVKRLNQLLNPALPGGVHLKTIECYAAMFECVNLENLVRDFDLLTIGLFNFSLSCKILVASEYLDLLEKIIMRLGPRVEQFSKQIMIGCLPFLDSESSEFYSRAYLILVSFLNQVSEKVFYTALWRNFINYEDLRISILNFLNKYKVVVIPEYNLVTNAFCIGLESDNPYITRTILDVSNRSFPYDVKLNIALQTPAMETTGMSNISVQSLPSDVASNSVSQGMDALSIRSEVSTMEATRSESSSKAEPVKAVQAVRDLVSDTIDINQEEVDRDKEKCNSKLIKSILKIFLKKEVGINKRAFKWLNISETVIDRDVDYIEKGLRVYLAGSEDDLLIFFRIINSLADKENLAVFLMDRLVVEALEIVMNLDNKKNNSEDKRNIDVFYNIKKNLISFLTQSLDEFYRVLYTKLNRLLEEAGDRELKASESSTELDVFSNDTESVIVRNDVVLSCHEIHDAEKLIRLIIYSVEVLSVVDTNVNTIHIPLLCHLIVRNKKKISHSLFTRFIRIFLERCQGSLALESREIMPALINRFYQKENTKELLEVNLVGALAKELSKMEIYIESTEDAIFWANSDLFVQNGMLVWSEMTEVKKIDRSKSGYFNFNVEDVEIIQEFIQKHGFKDLTEEFLTGIGKYLAHNYKFINLINELSHYIDHVHLRVNLWNDFTVSKNPKFLMHFQEAYLIEFVTNILPAVTLQDICLFLKEGLKIGKYFDILFRVATITGRKTSEFVDLLLTMNDTVELTRYILNRYYTELESEDPYKYDSVVAIVTIIQHLIENRNFISSIETNVAITLDKFGEMCIREAITNLLFSIIVQNQENRFNTLGIEDSDRNKSRILNYRNSTASLSTETVSEFRSVPYNDGQCSLEDSMRLLDNGYGMSNRINRLVFNDLYRLHKKGVSVACHCLEDIKKILHKNRNDFYLCKRSLFLIEGDIEFICENFLHFYKPIFQQINEMSQKDKNLKLKDELFGYLVRSESNCELEVLSEAVKYMEINDGVKSTDLFEKALSLIVERCQKCCVLYKRSKNEFKRVSTKALAEADALSALKTSNNVSLFGSALKSRLTEEDIRSLTEEENELKSLVLVKIGNLETVKELSKLLFEKNPQLFVNSIPDKFTSVLFFGIVPFKVELFGKLLANAKKSNPRILRAFSKMLSSETKIAVLRSEAENLKRIFGFNDLSVDMMKLAIELFKEEKTSDLSKIVFENILHQIEIRIESVMKNSTDFDEESKILGKILKMNIRVGSTVTLLKACCFSLLNSKKYHEKALDLIYDHLKLENDCKIFIDAFISHFNKNFFEFGVLKKKKIFELLESSTVFDQFAIIRNLMASMETSFFISAQNEEIIRINSIRKIAFLLLTQSKNKFASMSDNFVALINTLIGYPRDRVEIKSEVIRLSTVLMLKIDNHHIQTLFPILVADFVNTVQDENLRNIKDIIRVLSEIFQFVDISVWLNSQVFDFRVLFLDDHSFHRRLKEEVFKEAETEAEIDLNGSRLPNFIRRVFTKITQWNELGFYLHKAPEYYKHFEFHMVEKDYESVEENLALSFEETK